MVRGSQAPGGVSVIVDGGRARRAGAVGRERGRRGARGGRDGRARWGASGGGRARAEAAGRAGRARRAGAAGGCGGARTGPGKRFSTHGTARTRPVLHGCRSHVARARRRITRRLVLREAPAGMTSSRIAAPLIRGAAIRDPCCGRAGHLSRHVRPAGTGNGGRADH